MESVYANKAVLRIEQGDLIENLSYRVVKRTEDEITFDEIEFPYTIVITQDCDLEQDFGQRNEHKNSEKVEDHDKYIRTICLLPAYIAEAVRLGVHLEHLGLKMKKIDSNRWRPLRKNQVERFHFLPADTKRGIPELAIDFKHQYTIQREELYSLINAKPNTSRFKIIELFREDLSCRFANFLSRVALPVIQIP